MIDYNKSLDRTASGIRNELTKHIREAVNSNQECFIAHWLKQHPDADLSNITLCHGFEGNSYKFWVEEKQPTYTGTGGDYLDCVLGVGGFESFRPIDKEQPKPKPVYVNYPPDDCSVCPRTNGLHMWGVNHCRHCDQPCPEEYRSKK